MKRGNGEGSITKLKGNRRRPYLARGPAEYDPETGRGKRLILGSYRTRAEAGRCLVEYSRSPSKPYNITLGALWQMYNDQQRSRAYQNHATTHTEQLGNTGKPYRIARRGICNRTGRKRRHNARGCGGYARSDGTHQIRAEFGLYAGRRGREKSGCRSSLIRCRSFPPV